MCLISADTSFHKLTDGLRLLCLCFVCPPQIEMHQLRSRLQELRDRHGQLLDGMETMQAQLGGGDAIFE